MHGHLLGCRAPAISYAVRYRAGPGWKLQH